MADLPEVIEWVDFSDAIAISDEEISKWVAEGIKALFSDPHFKDQEHWCTSSGDTVVIVDRGGGWDPVVHICKAVRVGLLPPTEVYEPRELTNG